MKIFVYLFGETYYNIRHCSVWRKVCLVKILFGEQQQVPIRYTPDLCRRTYVTFSVRKVSPLGAVILYIYATPFRMRVSSSNRAVRGRIRAGRMSIAAVHIWYEKLPVIVT